MYRVKRFILLEIIGGKNIMKNNKNTKQYFRIPRVYIYDLSDYELLTYIELLRHELNYPKQRSACSIVDFCKDSDYSTQRRESSYLTHIRPILRQFISKGLISVDGYDVDTILSLNPQEFFISTLNESFIPSKQYVMISIKDFEAIIHSGKTYRIAALRLLLYIRDACNIKYNRNGEEESECAFYYNVKTITKTLQISQCRYDNCIDLLVQLGLIVKHVTGSYYNSSGAILNAPNIYAINNSSAQLRISVADTYLRNELLPKNKLNGSDFNKPVGVNKPLSNKKRRKLDRKTAEIVADPNNDWGNTDNRSIEDIEGVAEGDGDDNESR